MKKFYEDHVKKPEISRETKLVIVKFLMETAVPRILAQREAESKMN